MIKIILIATLISFSVEARERESYYQRHFCNMIEGEKEYVLKDKRRIDCLTNKYAIEIDFAEKWPECMGQAVGYSLAINEERNHKRYKTNPMCALIVGENDSRHVERARAVSNKINVKLIIIDAEKAFISKLY